MAQNSIESVTTDARIEPAYRPPKLWYLVAVLALGISAYALFVLVAGVYPEPLEESLQSRPWGIYPHAFFAIIGLTIGPWQFRGSGLRKRKKLHRLLGKTYVVAAFGTAVSGFYLALYAHGPDSNRAGFAVLALALMATTFIAVAKVRQRDFLGHRAWMLRSYALMFAAVTLRLWLPILMGVYQGDFDAAYQALGWLCWVPNLVWAQWYLARKPAPV